MALIVRKSQNLLQQWLDPKPALKPTQRTTRPGLINDRPHVSLFVGRKGSGKSRLLCTLLQTDWANIYNRIVFVSPTFQAQFDGLWSELSPVGITVHESLTDGFIEKLLQDVSASKHQTLLILDDCGDDIRRVAPAMMNKLVSNSRHLNLSIICLHQKITQSSTIIRSNCDSIISFASCSYLERESLWREISTVNKRDFNRMFQEATSEPHSYMVSTISRGGALINYKSDFNTVLI
jgi:hypothetical protein